MLEKNIPKPSDGPSASAMVREPGACWQQTQHQAGFWSLDRHVQALGSQPA